MPKQLDAKQAQGCTPRFAGASRAGRTAVSTPISSSSRAAGRGIIRGTRGPDPRLTITMDAVEFLRLVSGNSDPMRAYFTGR